MDRKDIEKNAAAATRLLKALANEKRLIIMCTLCGGEKNVGELEQIVGLSQSALSQHLARLRRDGLVSTRRVAQTVFYSTQDASVEAVLKTLCGLFSPEEPVGKYSDVE